MTEVSHIDHIVLAVQNMRASIEFYRDVLGFELLTFGADRKALRFGRQNFNLHPIDAPLSPPVKQHQLAVRTSV